MLLKKVRAYSTFTGVTGGLISLESALNPCNTVVIGIKWIGWRSWERQNKFLGKRSGQYVAVIGFNHQPFQVDRILNVVGLECLLGKFVVVLLVLLPVEHGKITIDSVKVAAV
jgi:hypothetical protein